MATRKKSTSPTVIFLTIFVIGASLCVFYLGTPTVKSLKEKTTELAIAKADLEAGKAYITDIRTAYGKLSAIESQLELLNIAAPTEPDLSEALVQINEIVNKNQLSLEAISPSQPSDGEVSIGLTVSGAYQQLKLCLVDLEKNLRPVKVDTVSLAAAAGDEGAITTGGTYTVKLSYVSAKESQSDQESALAGEATSEADPTAATGTSDSNQLSQTEGGANGR